MCTGRIDIRWGWCWRKRGRNPKERWERSFAWSSLGNASLIDKKKKTESRGEKKRRWNSLNDVENHCLEQKATLLHHLTHSWLSFMIIILLYERFLKSQMRWLIRDGERDQSDFLTGLKWKEESLAERRLSVWLLLESEKRGGEGHSG